MKDPKESYLSIDIETSGPNPGNYAMFSIGACTITEPRETFYIEFQPDADGFLQQSLAINKLSLKILRKTGIPPKDAMLKFSQWISRVVPEGSQPVFTAFNAPFDWMFINDYFHRCLGYNPFGHKALDIKAFYMGLRKTNWLKTSYISFKKIRARKLYFFIMLLKMLFNKQKYSKVAWGRQVVG